MPNRTTDLPATTIRRVTTSEAFKAQAAALGVPRSQLRQIREFIRYNGTTGRAVAKYPGAVHYQVELNGYQIYVMVQQNGDATLVSIEMDPSPPAPNARGGRHPGWLTESAFRAAVQEVLRKIFDLFGLIEGTAREERPRIRRVHFERTREAGARTVFRNQKFFDLPRLNRREPFASTDSGQESNVRFVAAHRTALSASSGDRHPRGGRYGMWMPMRPGGRYGSGIDPLLHSFGSASDRDLLREGNVVCLRAVVLFEAVPQRRCPKPSGAARNSDSAQEKRQRWNSLSQGNLSASKERPWRSCARSESSGVCPVQRASLALSAPAMLDPTPTGSHCQHRLRSRFFLKRRTRS